MDFPIISGKLGKLQKNKRTNLGFFSSVSIFQALQILVDRGTSNNLFPLKVGLRWFFCQWPEMGPEVGFGVQKWVQDWVKTAFHPLRDFREGRLSSQPVLCLLSDSVVLLSFGVEKVDVALACFLMILFERGVSLHIYIV